MSIREANNSDVSDIGRLVKSLSHFYLESDDTKLPDWFAHTITQSAFIRRIKSDEYHNFVYEIRGNIVGYISIKGNNHLYHLFVCKTHQGKGISRCLWNHAMQECKAQTYSLRSSIFAIPIYKKFGFSVVGDPGVKDGIGFQSMELRR